MRQLKVLFRPLYAPIVIRLKRRVSRHREQQRIQRQTQRALLLAKQSVQETKQSSESLKVIVGAGRTRYQGWIATDLPVFDVLKRQHWALLFPPNSIDRMLAEHVVEHLTAVQFRQFLDNARQYLALKGRIRIAVPDGNHPDPTYIANVRPGGLGPSADDHKVLYTCDLIGDLLNQQGFQFELLEYFDRDGRFHRKEWSADDGFVIRSAEHDKRNSDGQLNYTSLIFDCWL